MDTDIRSPFTGEGYLPAGPLPEQPVRISSAFRAAAALLIPPYDGTTPTWLGDYLDVRHTPSWWRSYTQPLDAPCPGDVHPPDWQCYLEFCAGVQSRVRVMPANNPEFAEESQIMMNIPARPHQVLDILREWNVLHEILAHEESHETCTRRSHRTLGDRVDGQCRGESRDVNEYLLLRLMWDDGRIPLDAQRISLCCCFTGPSFWFFLGFDRGVELLVALHGTCPGLADHIVDPPPDGEPVEGPFTETFYHLMYDGQEVCRECTRLIDQEEDADPNSPFNDWELACARLENEVALVSMQNSWENLTAEMGRVDPTFPISTRYLQPTPLDDILRRWYRRHLNDRRRRGEGPLDDPDDEVIEDMVTAWESLFHDPEPPVSRYLRAIMHGDDSSDDGDDANQPWTPEMLRAIEEEGFITIAVSDRPINGLDDDGDGDHELQPL